MNYIFFKFRIIVIINSNDIFVANFIKAFNKIRSNKSVTSGYNYQNINLIKE